MPADSPRPDFYRYCHEQTSLDSYVHEQVRASLIKKRSGLFDESNVHSYRHGSRWTLSASEDGASEMQKMAAESKIHTADVINHETAIIDEYISSMAEQLYGSMMEHVFQTVSQGAESVGNVVTRADHNGNAPLGFLAMLKKIQFGVDRYGRPQRPTMHVAPSTGKHFISSLQSQPREYHIEVENISEQKEKEASARETGRISRFRWNPT